MKKHLIFYKSLIVFIIVFVFFGLYKVGFVSAGVITGTDLNSRPYSDEWVCAQYGSGYYGTDPVYGNGICASTISNGCPTQVLNGVQKFSTGLCSDYGNYSGTVLRFQDIDAGPNCALTPTTD